MIPEFEESFEHEGISFSGIWTSFDDKSPAGDSHILTRTIRVLVDDETADRLPEGATISRLKTAEMYRVKNTIRSGVGARELDLERNDLAERYEGEF